MKAVNQCIGRVIRHRGDWAAILLVDQRWTSDTSQGKASCLPTPAVKLGLHASHDTTSIWAPSSGSAPRQFLLMLDLGLF